MKKDQQKYILPGLILGVAVIFVLMTFLVHLFGSGDDVYYDLSPSVSADFIPADGERSEDVAPENIILRNGDSAEYHIQMPDKEPLSDPVLCFVDYNCTIRVEYGHRTIYTYGDDTDAGHQFMGNLLVRVRVPEEALGHVIDVTVCHAQRIPANHAVSFGLMSASRAWKYPILGHETEFVIFFAMMFLSLILLVMTSIVGLSDHRAFRACLLLLFSFFVCAWYLGYNRFFYVMTEKTRFNSRVEYYALSYAPIPLLGYIISISHKGMIRRIYQVLLAGFAALAVFATAATRLPVDINFNDTLQLLQFLLIVFAAVMLFHMLLTLTGKIRPSRDSRILLYGFTAAMVFASMQILSFWIRDSHGDLPDWLRDFLGLDFASIGILVFVGTLVYSYATRSVEELVHEAQEDELQKLAYEDLLSGIHNRSWCVKQMEELREKERQFTVVFMDADGLKHANDVYGHETGDLLIRTVAEGIRESFGDRKGFYGRWGGDEFVAFFYEEKDAQAFASKFGEYQKKVNDNKTFPFLFSVSLGMCESGEIAGAVGGKSGEVNPTMVINEADRRMYERKKAAKKARESI